ncbi:MAG: hypothetical protein SOY11_02265 [Prevotella sp.]|nr:hypothetical protein [Prevotella sp.]MDY4150399.1 hypothetical protein [Prevotella sp.]
MKSKAKKLSLFTFAILSIGSFTGCIDNDYDLDGVDMTIGIGNGEFLLPSCSTDSIRLSEVLELNESETVVEKDNGDYYYLQDGNNVSPTHTKVDKITVVKHRGESQDFSFSVANYLHQSGKRTKTTNIPVDFNQKQVVYSFAYKGSIPNEVEELIVANTDGKITINTSFSPEVQKFVPVIAELSLELPSFLTIENVNSKLDHTQNGSKLVFKNVSTASNLKVDFTIGKIDFKKKSSPLGSLSTSNRNLSMNADIQMGIKINNIALGSSIDGADKCKITADMIINNDLVIEKVRGKFNPSIELDDLGSTDVTGIPDFLTNEGVVIDIDNPQIILNLESNLDVPGFIGGTLTAVKNGQKTANITIPEVKVLANATSKICICRNKSKVNQAAYTEVVEVPNLSTVLNPIPDHINFAGHSRADKTVEADFVLGKQYTIKPSYRIEAPLAFGENARIVYTDSFDDFNSDIKDIEVKDNTYIEFSGDIESKIPAYLNASAVAIDINGNEMPESEVKVAVDGEIKASADGKTPAVSTLKITMKPTKSALKKLDGLKFTVSGSAKSEKNTESVVGQTLNAKHHTLIIKNIKIKLVGQVIADLN